MIAISLALLAFPAPLSAPVTALQATPGPGIPLPRARVIRKKTMVTYVTGEMPGMDVIFRVAYDPRFDGAVVKVVVVEPRFLSLDGIDFLPGTDKVFVGMPFGIISHYDVKTGALLPDMIPVTDAIAVPPAGPGTHPSTVFSTPSHLYYIENQFGFGTTPSHRIIRKPLAGGPEEVVFDGGGFLVNLEGIEIVGGRLYFFCKEPGAPSTRALVSIGLAGGVWAPAPPALHIPGLAEGPAGDGSDELDFDPLSGLIFGTNIINGEIIAWDPFGGFEVSSPGDVHFIDGTSITASVGELSLLGASIDGIRSTHNGWLTVSGKGAVILSIDILGVLFDGADDGDISVHVFEPGLASFDDLTPIRRETY